MCGVLKREVRPVWLMPVVGVVEPALPIGIEVA